MMLVVSTAYTIGLILLLRPMARRIGLVDAPGGRKDHKKPTPVMGGVAVFLAFLLTLYTLQTEPGVWLSLAIAGLIVVIAGFLDDLGETPPSTRFVAQIVAMLVLVFWAGIRLDDLGALLGNSRITLGVLAVPFTIFCGVGVINATNMLDGLDGLAGSLMLIFFGILFFLARNAGFTVEAAVLGVLCATIIGFLVFNFRFLNTRPASVFMGDAGSLFMGLAAAWFLIMFTQKPYELLRPITAVWLFALPIMDTVAIMTRRVMRGRSPFSPDRGHFHHILLLAGFGVRGSVLIILGISLVLSMIGLAGEWAGVAESVMFYGFLALFALYFWGMNHAWKVMKVLHRLHQSY